METKSQFQVYNASAGSGKTFTLVKEYLKILLSTKDIFRFQNILAITFTNKAAAEMKERVLKNLHEFSNGLENDMFHIIAQELELSTSDLQSRSSNVLTTILQNYSAFNITTIDSFTHRIIRSFAFDLGLSINFEVEMDANLLLDEAVDVLISKIGIDDNLTQVLIDYSLEKSDDDKSWDISKDLKDFARVLLNENHINHLKLLDDKKVDDYLALKKRLKEDLKKIDLKFAQIGNQALEVINGMNLNPKDFYRSMLPNHFLNLATDFKKVKFFDQSKLKERIEEHNFYAKSKSEDIKTAIESILPPLMDLYDESEKLYQKHLLNSLVLKSLIPIAVLKQINASLNEIKEQNNIRLNAEFNQLIFDKIKGEPAPFIYEKIGERFRYYFIDEMQDTSELQWKNLIPLIENSLVSEQLDGQKGNLMLVGDAKQAIYRWRGGRAEQFIQLSQNNDLGIFSVEKEVKNLNTNFRSFSEIINFNNQFFSHISSFLGNQEYENLYREGNNQQTTTKEGGFVQLSFVTKDKEDPEIEHLYPKHVLSIIENLDSQFKKSEVCVLVRTKKQGIEISNYLAQHDIPIISSETLLLKNNSAVEFLTNLLLYIDNTADKKALANAMYFLSQKLNIEIDIHQFINDTIHLHKNEVFESLNRFGHHFNVQEFSCLPFYDAVEYCIRSFDLLNESSSFIQSFLDFILEYEQKRGFGLSDFLNHWERKKDNLCIALPDGQDAVRIMTIHKSKGLEFSVVIFPYDLNIYREIKPKIWYDNLNPNDFLGFETSLIDYSKKISYTGQYGVELFNARQEEIELDNLNLLYVALTRAIEQLYVITERQEKKKELENAKTYSDLFIDFLKSKNDELKWSTEHTNYQFGNKLRALPIKNEIKHEQCIQQEKFISSSWKTQNISIVANSSLLWDTDKEKAIEYGNLIHDILSNIKMADEVNSIINQYVFEGKLISEKVDEIREILNTIVNHPLLSKYFSQDYSILNEQELISTLGNIQIPDRICLSNNNATIIDYKTGAPKKQYHQQLNNYAFTLNDMGFKVQNQILVYINKEIFIELI